MSARTRLSLNTRVGDQNLYGPRPNTESNLVAMPKVGEGAPRKGGGVPRKGGMGTQKGGKGHAKRGEGPPERGR